jgi:hypothetical protein
VPWLHGRLPGTTLDSLDEQSRRVVIHEMNLGEPSDDQPEERLCTQGSSEFIHFKSEDDLFFEKETEKGRTHPGKERCGRRNSKVARISGIQFLKAPLEIILEDSRGFPAGAVTGDDPPAPEIAELSCDGSQFAPGLAG